MHALRSGCMSESWTLIRNKITLLEVTHAVCPLLLWNTSRIEPGPLLE